MSKKKYFRLLVLSAAAVLSAAGCQRGSDDSASGNAETAESKYSSEEIESYGLTAGMPHKGKKVKYLVTASGQTYVQEKYLDLFTDLTGIEVEFVVTPYSGILQKFTTESVGGTADYDLAQYTYSWGPSVMQFLEPLQQYVDRDGIDLSRWSAGYIDTATMDGRLYGLPIRGHAQLMFYRKDIFEENNLNIPLTWSELEETAGYITNNVDEVYGLAYQFEAGPDDVMYIWSPYLWSYDVDIFDKETLKPTFNSPRAKEATARLLKPLKEGILITGSEVYGETEIQKSFQQGDVAVIICWWWMYSSLVNPELSTLTPEQVGFAAVPGLDGGKATSSVFSMPVSITSYSRNKDAAWEFLKWLSSEKMEKIFVTDKSDSQYQTIVATNNTVLQDEEVNKVNNGIHQAAYESLKGAQSLIMFPDWKQSSDIIATALSKIATNQVGMDEGLDAAAEDVENLLEEAGYYD